jgi:hypothetical protein
MMKRPYYILVVILALVMSGFVVISFVEGKSQPVAMQNNTIPTAPTVLPTTLIGFPDIEQIPIYPNASITFTKNEPGAPRHVTLQVEESPYKLAAFYRETLPLRGWLLRNSYGPDPFKLDWYSWTDPHGKLPWQMYLKVEMELTLDQSRTAVYLEYQRYPIVEVGMPLYHDAQQVATSRSVIEKTFGIETVPVHITNVTYRSHSIPRQLADFYTSTLEEYGWMKREAGWSTRNYSQDLFEEKGSWQDDTQPGSMESREGLFFAASRPSWESESRYASALLLASATVQPDGWVVIRLHVEECELTVIGR